MLRLIGYHIHAIEFFDEIAFPKEGTHNSQTAGWDNAFICKLNNNVLIGAQCDSVVVIHGKRLQSIGFVTSILPYIFFTWWVNNDMNNKVSQKLEIIGFKESVKKYTTIYFFIYFLYYIYVLPVFSVDEISPDKPEDHHWLS